MHILVILDDALTHMNVKWLLTLVFRVVVKQ